MCHHKLSLKDHMLTAWHPQSNYHCLYTWIRKLVTASNPTSMPIFFFLTFTIVTYCRIFCTALSLLNQNGLVTQIRDSPHLSKQYDIRRKLTTLNKIRVHPICTMSACLEFSTDQNLSPDYEQVQQCPSSFLFLVWDTLRTILPQCLGNILPSMISHIYCVIPSIHSKSCNCQEKKCHKL